MSQAGTDDERLIRSLAQGDEGALRELFDRHAPWLATRLRGRMPAHAVEDVLQETFIAVWRNASGYEPQGVPGAWLWGIARRQAAAWARKNRYRPEEVTDPATAEGSEKPEISAATRADLDRALGTLGDEYSEQRRLARLVFIEDRPIAEVARTLDIPQGTVKSRLYRLRRVLREALRRGESYIA